MGVGRGGARFLREHVGRRTDRSRAHSRPRGILVDAAGTRRGFRGAAHALKASLTGTGLALTPSGPLRDPVYVSLADFARGLVDRRGDRPTKEDADVEHVANRGVRRCRLRGRERLLDRAQHVHRALPAPGLWIARRIRNVQCEDGYLAQLRSVLPVLSPHAVKRCFFRLSGRMAVHRSRIARRDRSLRRNSAPDGSRRRAALGIRRRLCQRIRRFLRRIQPMGLPARTWDDGVSRGCETVFVHKPWGRSWDRGSVVFASADSARSPASRARSRRRSGRRSIRGVLLVRGARRIRSTLFVELFDGNRSARRRQAPELSFVRAGGSGSVLSHDPCGIRF